MSDLTDIDGAESPPPNCEQLNEEARSRPKSLRLLPRICRDAFSLVWQASPRALLASVGLKLLNGLALGAALLLGRDLVASVLAAGAHQSGFLAVAPQLAAVIGTIVLLGLVTAAGREVREVLSETTARHAKERIIDVAAAVELSAYETPSFHNRLARAATGEHRPIQLVDGLIGAIGDVASIVGITVALLAVQPLLAGVFKAGQALFGFHMRMTAATRARDYLYRLLTRKDPAKEVRAFGLTGYLTDRHARLYDLHMTELRRTARRRFRIAVTGIAILALALGAGITGLLALATNGTLGLAEAATAGGALLILGERVMTLVNDIGNIYEAGLFVEDYTTFLATAPVDHATTGSLPAPLNFDRITVEAVTFTYPSADGPALRDVSLDIPAGSVVALVGENGSGKTTLAKLLCRLYLPDSGTVRWDETDTSQVDPYQLRRRIAVIFQDFAHFDLSARENIGLGAVEHIEDLPVVREAARHAGADSYLIALPDGYDTILSPEYDGGRDLSVGQWQRVALARAFIRDAPLIILDEPTAALDPRAEHQLFTSIRKLYAGRTVLLISHRYSTVREADHIYVLHNGQIVERGSHDRLLALGGTYAEIGRAHV